MTNVLIIYHADCRDGFCAAWVARKYYPDAEFVPAFYGTEPPDCTGKIVFMLDFSYPEAQMRRVISECRKLTVLDHHKTALATLTNIVAPEKDYQMRFDTEKSGARLTWEWFNGAKTAAPWLVDYTEDRDLWRWARAGSREINAGLSSYPLNFQIWDDLSENSPARFFLEGESILRMEAQIADTHLAHAREVSIAGHRVKVVNCSVYTLTSVVAGRLAKDAPFGACYFDRADGKRQWSLRSEPGGVDVSEIAKAYGGGGHTHAAGFETELT